MSRCLMSGIVFKGGEFGGLDNSSGDFRVNAQPIPNSTPSLPLLFVKEKGDGGMSSFKTIHLLQ